jgi:hypothetical protein
MKITFITPHVGRKNSKEYVHTWQMEPLTIATLAGLTPPDIEFAYQFCCSDQPSSNHRRNLYSEASL